MSLNNRVAKYIVYKHDDMEHGIIFSMILKHKDFARHFSDEQIVSAGFVNIVAIGNRLEIATYGESESLGVKSRPNDNILIECTLLPKICS